MTASRPEEIVRLEYGSGLASDENAVDLAMAQTLIDSSRHDDGQLVKLDKKAFTLDEPMEPISMKESVIVKIAYGLPD